MSVAIPVLQGRGMTMSDQLGPARPQDARRRRRCASRAPGAPTPSSTSGSPGWPARCSSAASAPATGSPSWRSTGWRRGRPTWPGVRLGAIVVPVNFRLVADEVAYVLADSGRHGARRRRRAGRGRPPRPASRRPTSRRCSSIGERVRGGARRGGRRAARRRRRRGRARLHHVHVGHDRPAQGRRADPPQPADARVQPDRPTSAGTPRTGSPPPARRCSTSPGWPAGCRRCCWAAPT